MKLSTYIKKLQDFLKENGDMNCYYSSDDEGNSYQEVYYSGTLMYTDDPEGYNPEVYGADDEYDDVDLYPICIIN